MNNRYLYTSLLAAAAAAIGSHAQAQTVQAHFGQYLVTTTMSGHPELQKMGLHVVAPGATDDSIVACSVPSKIGKKSSAPDLAVEQSGKANVKLSNDSAKPGKSFYDLALPLHETNGKAIGLMVMELRASAAANNEEALRKAEAITQEVEKQIPSLSKLFDEAPATTPLLLTQTTPLPDITGDFDHLAIDHLNGRLYAAAEEHHSIEVFDLKTGKRLQSVPGVQTPHTIAFVPERNLLMVADGGDASCKLIDVRDMHEVKRIALAPGPDGGYYDATNRVFYIGNGGRTAKQPFSYVSAVSADEGRILYQVRVEADNLESMALNREKNLLYVNMRDKKAIGVIDLEKKEVVATWAIPDLNLNTPMAFDAQQHRLFLAGRKPGKFYVVDSESGHVVQAMDCVEIADDMTYDAAAHRIYISGAGGIAVFHQDAADRYTRLTQFDTNSGKTSILDRDAHRLFVLHTKTDLDKAALQVYSVQ